MNPHLLGKHPVGDNAADRTQQDDAEAPTGKQTTGAAFVTATDKLFEERCDPRIVDGWLNVHHYTPPFGRI